MITEYIFDAANGELVSSTRKEGSQIFRRVYFDDLDIEHLISTIVCENETAEREFFNHFGDDSSWPPGWWRAIGAPQFDRLRTRPLLPIKPTLGFFTRESWRKENHS